MKNEVSFIVAVDLSRFRRKNQIINTDESFCRCCEMDNIAWDPINTDDVYININGEEKASFTFISTITFDGGKLPLALIAKGKTTVAEKKWFGKGYHICTHNIKKEKLQNPFFNVNSFTEKEEYFLLRYRSYN